MPVSVRPIVVVAALLRLGVVGVAAQAPPAAAPPEVSPAPAASPPAAALLPGRFADWLEQVSPLLTAPERSLFRALREDYQRDAFIRRFWQVRDPFPETARNELRERWEERSDFARANFRYLSDSRSRILLVHGEPSRRVEVRCGGARTAAEIWLYTHSDYFDFRVVLVFIVERASGRASLWIPSRSGAIGPLVNSAGGCQNGALLGQVAQDLEALGSEYEGMLSRVLAMPRPRSTEWVSTFAAERTELPEGAKTFPAELEVAFLGRHQQRTVVQGVVVVDPERVARADLAGYRSYNFLLLGEVLLDDQLFESFRYKFGYPIEPSSAPASIPLLFQRFLRPGSYRLIVRLEDLNGAQFFRTVNELVVPELKTAYLPQTGLDPDIQALFEEAAVAVRDGETTIEIVPPPGELYTGFVRFAARATGDVEAVRFFLEDRPILVKTTPPYSVELDLGEFPRVQQLRVEALGPGDRILAADEIALNSGGYRFAVRLVEPHRNRTYQGSVRARAEIEVPENEELERVEFFVDDRLIATLYQEPFVQPVPLPPSGKAAYVRAVAYLADGNSAEDLVFVNSPDLIEEVDVQFVELFAAVTGRDGRAIADLAAKDFSVEEDGRREQVVRFARVENLPIHVGVLIDNSASMQGAIESTRQAALQFFREAIGSRDRAAVITFNRFPTVAVKLTSDLAELGGGLAGLTAEGQTALFDSLMFTLHYFSSVSGQRAVLLLSDGRDEVSRFSFEETLEFARRAGVTVYTIGLGINEGDARRRLAAFGEETGGQSYFIRGVDELAAIYATIQRELRSQYLVGYQSTSERKDPGFRRVEVKVRRAGADVKTISGYYP